MLPIFDEPSFPKVLWTATHWRRRGRIIARADQYDAPNEAVCARRQSRQRKLAVKRVVSLRLVKRLIVVLCRVRAGHGKGRVPRIHVGDDEASIGARNLRRQVGYARSRQCYRRADYALGWAGGVHDTAAQERQKRILSGRRCVSIGVTAIVRTVSIASAASSAATSNNDDRRKRD